MEAFVEETTLGSLKVLEVYEYYDGPRLFTSLSDTGSLFLVLWIKSTSMTDEYYVRPMSFRRLGELREGKIGLRDALLRPEGAELSVLRLIDNLANAD